MTATATLTVQAVDTYATPRTFASPFSFSAPESLRSASAHSHGRPGSRDARTTLKRSIHSRDNVTVGTGRSSEREEGQRSSQSSVFNPQSTWLRRLSNMSLSHDSSLPSISRPGSAPLSQSSDSMAYSNTGSTTPVFSNATPQHLLPNKLVKRTGSLRSIDSSPLTSSGSRLPIPVFKRPATSHQRSVTLQSTASNGRPPPSDAMSLDLAPQRTADSKWRNYFSAKIAAEQVTSGMRKRNLSGIPNPIRRVYPDRKYSPTLISAGEAVARSGLEIDGGISEDETGADKAKVGPSFSSSPLLASTAAVEAEEERVPRRSFSIGDLLSTGPQLWKRPAQGKSKIPGSRQRRESGRRVVSAPQKSAMGGLLSTPSAGDSERPAKRRDLTDPRTSQRSIYSSSSSINPSESQARREVQLHLGSTKPEAQSPTFFASRTHESTTHPAQHSLSESHDWPSPTATSTTVRPIRPSVAHSEITSTSFGSDSENRSVADDSTDYGDAIFDSIRTRTTRSSSGRRGPPIETIFDDSPPDYNSGKSTMLRDLLQEGAFPASGSTARYRHSTIEEEDITGTPRRSSRQTSSPLTQHGVGGGIASSPPEVPHVSDPDAMDWEAPDDDEDDKDSSWSFDDHGQPTSGAELQAPFPLPEKTTPLRLGLFARSNNSSSATSTPQRTGIGLHDKDARSSIFDWSEQQPSPAQGEQSPPRPKTSGLGKAEVEARSSRNAGRRAVSGLHARSHSVPVVPDVDGKRSQVGLNKFGTWGLGSKPVTEDWNEDFDFDEAPLPMPQVSESSEKRIDSGHEMFVPKSIREQQESVVANIGLLREWGLLIEELKELRIRAVALDMLNGMHAQAWKEVDAMIELADQETEEQTLDPRRSPPSSPGFDYDAFDEPLPNIANTGKPRRPSVKSPEPTIPEDDQITAMHKDRMQQSTPTNIFTTRPRKDSEAVARSVIEALQSKRSVSDPSVILRPVEARKKVPFDTATLRHIVPYVNGLKRKIKDALRETEGLYSSPARRTPSDDEPAFSSIFHDPPESPSARRKARRSKAATDHVMSDEAFQDKGDELAKHLQMMAVI